MINFWKKFRVNHDEVKSKFLEKIRQNQGEI